MAPLEQRRCHAFSLRADGWFEFEVYPDERSGLEPGKKSFNLAGNLSVLEDGAPGGKTSFFTSDLVTDIHLGWNDPIMHYRVCSEECQKDRTYQLLQIFDVKSGVRAWKHGTRLGSNLDLSIPLNDVLGLSNREIITGGTGFDKGGLIYEHHVDDKRPWLLHYKAHLPGCFRTYDLLQLFDVYHVRPYLGYYEVVGAVNLVELEATPAEVTQEAQESTKPNVSDAVRKVTKGAGAASDDEALPKYSQDNEAKALELDKAKKDLDAKALELDQVKKERDAFQSEVEKLRAQQKPETQTTDDSKNSSKSEIDKLRDKLKEAKMDALVTDLRHKLEVAELTNKLQEAEIQRLKSGAQSADEESFDDFPF